MSKMSKLRRASSQSHFRYKNNNMSYGIPENIIISKHVIKRFRERADFHAPDEFIIDRIRQHIRHSHLVSMNNGQEQRSCEGLIYVCVRKYIKGIPSMVVVTLLQSECRQKQGFKGKMTDFISKKEERLIAMG